MFSHGACVRVVINLARRTKFAFENVFDRYVRPGGQVWGRLDDTSNSIKWPTTAHAKPERARTPVAAQSKLDQMLNLFERMLRSQIWQRGELLPVKNAVGMFRECHSRFRPTDVNANQHSSSSCAV